MSKEQRTTREGQDPKVDVRGKRVLVVGLARSGRTAAHALRRRGAVVTVTDLRPPSAFAAEIPELLSAKIGLELGLHRLETFLRHDFIIASPGVPGDLAQFVAARERKVRIVPEVEVAGWFLKGTLVGITGSNGKTTTTKLLGGMLEASGFDTFVGGNIGVPLISAVDQTTDDSITVAELSSFQLEAVQNFRVNVAVLLNITPNHLDRHLSFDAYIAAKAGIFRNQTGDDWAVLNADDPTVMSLSPALSGRKVLFSLHQDLPDGVLVSNGKVVYRVNNLERVLMDVADVKLRGAFNLENVLAAAAAACVVGADFDALSRVVRDFRGVEHRLEYVRQIRGVDFYNDSKATSVDATVKALSAFEHGVHLILGGKDKGAPYAPLRPQLERRVRRVLLIGAAADRIANELAGATDLVRAGDLETAVREAFRASVPGDTVLLAPACASFDQFQDFEHRGRVFKEVVGRLATEKKARETQSRQSFVQNPKLENENSSFESQQSAVSNQLARGEAMTQPRPDPHHKPRVLSRPELVYVYEVAAEELAPMEGEFSQEPQGKVYEESDLLRQFPAGGTDYEPLPFEVSIMTGTSYTGAGSQAKSGVTARDSRAGPPGAEGSDSDSGGSSNSLAGGGDQGRLFESPPEVDK